MPEYYWGHKTEQENLDNTGQWTYTAPLLTGKGMMSGVVRLQVQGLAPNSELHFGFREKAPDGKFHRDVGSGEIGNNGGYGWFRIPFVIRNETGGVVQLVTKSPYDKNVVITDIQVEGLVWRP